MPKLREYHFSFGNSTKGVVGACAVVRAHSKKEAVELLQSAMPDEYETTLEENEPAVVSFRFYLGSENVKAHHVDRVEILPVCDACGEAPEGGQFVGCPDGAEICSNCFNAGAH